MLIIGGGLAITAGIDLQMHGQVMWLSQGEYITWIGSFMTAAGFFNQVGKNKIQSEIDKLKE